MAANPAALAGFLAGDVMVAIEGTPVATFADLKKAVAAAPVPMQLTVMRHGEQLVLRYPR